ncbi:serine-rich adhesin for platelets isoform X3 [Stomoxys calcitrans]|uniref:serine-rich adhesin for platelets isoform X3 n=1 Tax=Stomoxys calcitrans TaxID=35570 RepID=UPI0027E3165B|nr:serine-rich adhesin for platelets isoform X3 [Stomoxys calcitrans]
MGKCISKNSTSLTIALSDKDLARASHILSKFTESSEYIALKDEHRNQLCECFAVNDTCIQPQLGLGEKVSTISAASIGSEKAEKPTQKYYCHQQSHFYGGGGAQHLGEQEFGHPQQDTSQDNTCLHSVDYEMPTDSRLLPPKSTSYNGPNRGNDAFQSYDDYVAVVHALSVAPRTDNKYSYSKFNEPFVDDDRCEEVVDCSNFCDGKRRSNKYYAKDGTNYDQSVLANNNNNNEATQKNNYCTGVPQYLAQLLVQHQIKDLEAKAHETTEIIVECHLECDTKRANNKTMQRSQALIVANNNAQKGQTESKKHSKKHNAGEIQTKGTAMSFGFRKNLNTTPKKLKKFLKGENAKKKQDKCNNIYAEGTEADTSDGKVGVAGTLSDVGLGGYKIDSVIDTSNTTGTSAQFQKDDNGNADLLNNIHFDKMGAAAANALHLNTTTSTATSGGANVRLPGAGSRFGYRGTIRPSSTDITSRCQKETNENNENNNCPPAASNTKGVLISNLKRRSKSAHAGRTNSTSNESESDLSVAPRTTQPKTLTFNLKQNSTIEYDRRQFFEQQAPSAVTGGRGGSCGGMACGNVISTGMHHNVILRPTARLPATASTATAYTKYTLQTVSLPKPEFAVPISINVTTPTTPASISYNSSSSAASSSSRTRDNSWSRQHPLTVAQSTVHRMDPKAAKHMTNSTRRTFSGSREISADSGIASLDMALDSSGSSRVSSATRKSSPKRSRSRPRNLQMVMNGRHRFEVRDLDDSLSSGDSSIVEPLALPKLPTESQTVPLPLSGLIRSNTVLSRESYESRNRENKQKQIVTLTLESNNASQSTSRQASEEDSESVDEEKLHLDRSATEKIQKERQFKDINTCSSKTSSPGSSVLSSWCNAGESLAANDFSTLSLDSSEDSNKQDNKLLEDQKETERKLSFEINDDDLVTLNSDVQMSTLSSLTEPVTLNDEIDNLPKESTNLAILDDTNNMVERPKSICNSLNESKFAEMALEGSTFLLDDETSPTDSLVSSSESEGAACKQKKHKINEELQEKDIDEISPELDLASPLSPGTPTHCSRSLSLSDCGNLIDDEIADQPALLFNQESQDGGAESGASRRDRTDTPTLMESLSSLRNSIHSQTNRSRSALYQAMELSLRTPLSLRKAVMERAESLDTLSPCESICSDDLMMDFDMASSMDSIDRSVSIKSRSGSDLNKIDDGELFSEFNRKGNDVMQELNSLLRSHSKKNKDRDITAHLPARATRLLNRSRMQQHCTLNNDNDSDSARSPLSARRRNNTASSRNSTASSVTGHNNRGSGNNTANSSLQRKYQQHNLHLNHQPTSSSSYHQHQRDTHSSSDDLMLYDKSFRNAMIQDVLQFKKQLLRLRKILQETETLNPFENDNGQLFTSCGLDSKLFDDIDLASLTSSTTDDPVQELSDLRRQGQVDDRDRTIRLQKNRIEQLEAEKHKLTPQQKFGEPAAEAHRECVTTATQTERTRPLSIGTEGLSRSKPEYTSFTTYFPAICGGDSTTVIQQQNNSGQQNQGSGANNQTRRHTIISTTLTNYNHQMSSQPHPQQQQHQQQPTIHSIQPRRASIAWDKQTAAVPAYKPVKITLIGDPLKQWNGNGSANENLPTNDEESKKKNLINTSDSPIKQQQHNLQEQKQNMHNNNKCSSGSGNLILNGKANMQNQQQKISNVTHQQQLQDLLKANELLPSAAQHQQQYHHHHHHPHHHLHHQRHQHNNLKPTVTIV